MTLFAFLVAVTAGAQSPTWNPDYNADEIVGTADLMGLLSVFGDEWTNDAEVLVIDSLNDTAENIAVDTIDVSLNDIIVQQHIDLIYPDSIDVLVLNDFYLSQGDYLDGYVDGWQYSTIGPPELRIELPAPIDGKCICLLTWDAYYSGAIEWRIVLQQSASHGSVLLNGSQNRMRKFCAYGSRWYVSGGL